MQACGIGELGQRWDLKRGQHSWLEPCLEERLEVETSHVHVNKACSLNGPWLLVVFTAWGFAIFVEIIKVFTYASTHNFVMLQKVDYVHYFHFIVAVYLLYSNCI